MCKLSNKTDYMDLTNTYRTFHQNTTECTFFSVANRVSSKIDYQLVHKTSFSKYRKSEAISCKLSDHNGIRLQINIKRKYTNSRKLNSVLLSDWVHEEINKETKNSWDQMKIKIQHTKICEI